MNAARSPKLTILLWNAFELKFPFTPSKMAVVEGEEGRGLRNKMKALASAPKVPLSWCELFLGFHQKLTFNSFSVTLYIKLSIVIFVIVD